MNVIRVVLIDDHRIVRQGLRSILDPDSGFEVVGEASNGISGLRIIAELKPDAVLLDLGLPDIGGVEVCQRIAQTSPNTAILILTAFADRSLIDACLRAGARGYLLKDAENLHLRENLRSVVDGNAVLDPRTTCILVDYMKEHEPLPEALTRRELDVLHLVSQGLTNKEIGMKLYLSENTIKGHVKGILAKMEVHSRIEMVILAKERGLI